MNKTEYYNGVSSRLKIIIDSLKNYHETAVRPDENTLKNLFYSKVL